MILASAAIAAALSLLAPPGFGTRTRRPATVCPASSLPVPHAQGAIALDGDMDDLGWTAWPGPARTGPFLLASGAAARPYSDARVVWGEGHLYLALYAADDDIRSRVDEPDGPLWLDDSFRLVFTRSGVEYAIEVSPNGVVTDARRSQSGRFDYGWNSGSHVSYEREGTLNDSRDADEEWVIEMAIPFEALGMHGERGERVGFTVRRCDTPKDEPRVCASWGDPGTELVLD